MDKKKSLREVKIYFIIPVCCSSKDDINKTMKMAFQEVKEADLSPKWQNEASCDLSNCTKNTVFVLQQFKGELFDRLCSTKSVVCGPMCLRSCIAEGLSIPENKSPVYTTAMRDVIVTASEVSTETELNIKKKVEFMGGVYTNNLSSCVTHLVTNTVHSAKYEIACEKGILVMTLDWVEATWEQSQKKKIKATNPKLIARYKCPIFLNMYITCSNLSQKEREELIELITRNGGTFTGHMYHSKTTLLVISEPRGEKYKHARSWGLPCVLPSYIMESVKCGYAVPLKKHLITATVSCSTPTKDEDLLNTKSPATQATETSKLDSTDSTEYSRPTCPEIFSGLTFVIAGFDSEVIANIEGTITKAGGSVVASNFTGVADYAVVPVQTALPNTTAVEVVTHLWLEDCLAFKEKLPLKYYHQPLSVDLDRKPLTDCCISLSNFFSKEKAFLIEVVQLLGAKYQDIFSRFDEAHEGKSPSTHLVCPKPQGQKYDASVKWGIPAVTKDWLLACAHCGTRLAESRYLVTKPQVKLGLITSDESKESNITPEEGDI